MSLTEGLFIGALYFVAFLGALLVGAAVVHVSGAEQIARFLRLPWGNE